MVLLALGKHRRRMPKAIRSLNDDFVFRTNFKLKLAELEALFLSIGEGVIVTDGQARISRINEPALQILGYECDEVMGKWYPETVIAEDLSGNTIPNLERPMTEAFIRGASVFKRMLYYTKSGKKVAVAVTVSPVMLEDKPIGAIEVFRDITEEVKHEKSKDEFIALASHQLRTPATSVKQYLGMVLQGFAGDLTDEQTTLLSKAFESNERQIKIINDLLRVAQIDAGRMKLVLTDTSINNLLEELACDLADKFTSRKQKIQLILPENIVMAKVDLQRFRMALENIIDNASKYTPDGKTIIIYLREVNNLIEIEIKDEGVGIAAENLPLVFEKFSRIDNPLSVEAGGTGIGLYWVTKILNLHGARIEVKSKVGKGSSFTIILSTKTH